MDPNQFQPVEGVQPTIVPGGTQPAIVPGGVPSTSPDQQKQVLLDLIKQIRGKLSSLKALGFATDNKTENMRRELLRKVFERMQMAGIDLNDRQSVADFIERMRSINPELAQIFEEAMNIMLGDESGGMNTPQGSGPVDLGVEQPGFAPQNMNNQNVNQNEAIPPQV